MPRLKKKSQAQKRLDDQLRKEASRKDVGVHEFSFNDLNLDEILHGEVDIQILDYTTQVLKAQYHCSHGMLPPSYLHSLVTTPHNATCPRIPSHVNAVQIHYIPGHYLLSARQHKRLFVYDSLPSDSQIQSVAPQLNLLYEQFTITDVEYKTPQNQGFSPDCAVFAVANAVALLNNTDPQTVQFVTSEMRNHLCQSLREGIVNQFPHVRITNTGPTAFPSLLSSYFQDQLQKQDKKSDSERQRLHRKKQQELMTTTELLEKRKCESRRLKNLRKQKKSTSTSDQLLQEKQNESKRLSELRNRKKNTSDELLQEKWNKSKRITELRNRKKSTSTKDELLQEKRNENKRISELRNRKKNTSTSDELLQERQNESKRITELRNRKKSTSTKGELLQEKRNESKRKSELRNRKKSTSTKGELLQEKRNESKRISELRNRKKNTATNADFLQEKEMERERVHNFRRKRSLSQVNNDREVDRKKKKADRNPTGIAPAIAKFKKDIKQFPEYVCTCCRRLLYKRAVRRVSSGTFPKLSDEFHRKCITGRVSVLGIEWICNTCFNYVKTESHPSASKVQ